MFNSYPCINPGSVLLKHSINVPSFLPLYVKRWSSSCLKTWLTKICANIYGFGQYFETISGKCFSANHITRPYSIAFITAFTEAFLLNYILLLVPYLVISHFVFVFFFLMIFETSLFHLCFNFFFRFVGDIPSNSLFTRIDSPAEVIQASGSFFGSFSFFLAPFLNFTWQTLTHLVPRSDVQISELFISSLRLLLFSLAWENLWNNFKHAQTIDVQA